MSDEQLRAALADIQRDLAIGEQAGRQLLRQTVAELLPSIMRIPGADTGLQDMGAPALNRLERLHLELLALNALIAGSIGDVHDAIMALSSERGAERRLRIMLGEEFDDE